MTESGREQDRSSWAGPVLFVIVLALITAFFVWFVQA
jgi:hypothetical protein